MGAGTNRMNKYTVGKATKGLGEYLLATYGAEAFKECGVVIKVYLHTHARPTPQFSFSVKFWNAVVGVVITVSPNPKKYNGYKVYDEFGCQLVPWQAKQVIKYVDAVTDYKTIDFMGNN